MQIPYDNFFADWKTDQIRVPMNRALRGYSKTIESGTDDNIGI
jgi:hypothetical protein